MATWKLTLVFEDYTEVEYFEAPEEKADELAIELYSSTNADDFYTELVEDDEV